jgi:PAS domain S-box-containing protein
MSPSEQVISNRPTELEKLRARVVELEREGLARLAAEEALRTSESRYRRLVEGVRLIAWEFDVATRQFTFVSHHAEDILGYPLDKWRAAGFWYDHLHPEDRERATAYCREHVAHGEDHELEYRMIHADGRVVWIKDITTVARRDSGDIILHGAFVDITEPKAAEQVLRRQAQIIEQIHDAVIETDLQGVIRLWNRGAERIYGYASSEAIGQHVSFLYFPEDLYLLQEHVLDPLHRKGEHEVEKRIRRKSGEACFIHLSLSMLRDEAGAAYGMIGYSTDLTQRHNAEEALRRSEERLRAILRNSPAAIYIKDPAGAYLEYSRQAEVWTGLSRECVLGRTDHDLFPKKVADTFVADDQAVLKSRRIVQAERLVPHQNELHTHLDIKFPLLDNEGKPYAVCGISTDIDESKRAEDARRESTELQRMMLSELDHRVRNNLAALAALIDISMRDKHDVREFAESIRSRVQAMSAVHSLLSRAHWLAVSLRSLIETLTPHDLQGCVLLDGPDVLITPRQVTALGMVLQEVMANSLKYGALRTVPGRVELTWTVSETRTNDGRRFELSWRESGGPPITAAPTTGQGTELIQGFVRTELRGVAHLSYPATGAFHRFILNLDRTV